jgi:hypothetical protein
MTISVIVVMGLLGVGGATSMAEPGDSTSTPVITTLPERPESQTATPFTDDPSIVDSHAQAIESWSRLDDDRAIAVHFTTGTPECYGVQAEVQETADIVAVKLRSGVLPAAVGRACTMIAVFGTLTVNLDAPVGNRAVVSIT